jgi:hypothetical protein
MAHQLDGGAVGTPWRSLTVGQMWDMVKDHDEAPGWAEAVGWRRTFELVDYHYSRLQQYRDVLAERLPPERNEAAGAFLAKVDTLMSSMVEMRDAAAANGPALTGITAGMSEAKTKLGPVYEKWAANKSEINGNGQGSASGNGTPAPAPAPSPISPTEQENLKAQAVSIMSALAAETVQSKAAMRTPAPYELPIPSFDPLIPVPGASTALESGSAEQILGRRYAAGQSAGPQLATRSIQIASSNTSPTSEPAPRPVAATAPIDKPGQSDAHLIELAATPTPTLPPRNNSAVHSDGSASVERVPADARFASRHDGSGDQQLDEQWTRSLEPTLSPHGATQEPESQLQSSNRSIEPTALVGGATNGPRGMSRRRSGCCFDETDEQWPVNSGVDPVIAPHERCRHFDPGPALGLSP